MTKRKNGVSGTDVLSDIAGKMPGGDDAPNGGAPSPLYDDDEIWEAAAPGAAADIATETLTGDIRDFILDTLRHEQDRRPWHDRSEADQRITVARVESAVESHVRRAVELIAAAGHRTIKATIESITVKDGLKATLTMSKFDDLRHAFIDAQGKTVMVVVADTAEFTGERAPVVVKPDQGALQGIASVSAVVHSAAQDNHEAVPFN